MKVVMRANLGLIDAKTLGLDHKLCVIGATVEVTSEAAERMIKKGIAVAVEAASKDPVIQSSRGVDKDGDACQTLPTDQEPVAAQKVKGQSEKPAITAPAK